MNSLQILTSKISIGSYDAFVSQIVQYAKQKDSKYVCVANVHMLIEAYRNKSFRSVLQQADIVTPDGMPLVWYSKLVRRMRQERVCGMDLLPDLLTACQKQSLSVFIYGGNPQQLKTADKYLKDNYPSLRIAGLYSPPFKDLVLTELNTVSHVINESHADLVLVCLGCPKQEKWMYQMKGTVHAPMVGIGGALPVLIGLNKRAPLWMQRSGLEWVFRFIQEPRRLFKRYFVTNSIFLVLFFRDLFLIRFFGGGSRHHSVSSEGGVVIDI